MKGTVEDSHLAEEGFQTQEMPQSALDYISFFVHRVSIECLAT